MKQYLDLLSEIRHNGNQKGDRTGTGTLSIFGAQMRFDLSKGFPLITTKKTWLKGIIHELLWLISGDTNIKYLQDNGVHIWDEWADENGELGPVYGHQWRRFGEWEDGDGGILVKGVDQLAEAIHKIKTKPDDRRIIVNAWNPTEIDAMGLPPCHMFFQFYVNNGKLSCQMYQRSADMFLGVPFNIASYSLLTMMVAQVCNLEPGDFIHTIGDAHIYNNHIDQVDEQLSRAPKELPTIEIGRRCPLCHVDAPRHTIMDINVFKYEDFKIIGYDPHPAIKGEVSV